MIWLVAVLLCIALLAFPTDAHAIIEEDTFRPGCSEIQFSEQMPTPSRSFVIRAHNVFDQSNVASVEFQITNSAGEQVTLPAVQAEALDWMATFDAVEHFGTLEGAFKVEAVGCDTLGNLGAMKEALVEIVSAAGAPTMEALALSVLSPTDAPAFTMAATNVSHKDGVKNVRFRVWRDGNLENATWLEGSQKDGSWSAEFVLNNFDGKTGIYNIEAYGSAVGGETAYMGVKRIDVVEQVTNTPIMGESQANVQQLVDYFNSSIYEYPIYYEEAPRSTGLEEFAQLYYDICKAEGVRAEVAWAQMCLETKFLNYGNLVNREQFNFAGLGATGPGEPGFNFAEAYGDNAEGIKMGIIGHVQHLKCYASDQPVQMKSATGQPVDPRWNDSLRKTVETVERLEGKWAASAGYGMDVAQAVAGVVAQ